MGRCLGVETCTERIVWRALSGCVHWRACHALPQLDPSRAIHTRAWSVSLQTPHSASATSARHNDGVECRGQHPVVSAVAPLLTMVTAGGGVLPPRGTLAAVRRAVTVTGERLLGLFACGKSLSGVAAVMMETNGF